MFELEIDSRMNFEFYFSDQLKRHPSIEHQDVIKLCYQAAFGAEHILSNAEAARGYLESEFASIEPSDEPLFEWISADVCRVNLGAWKKKDLPLDELFKAFLGSATINKNGKEAFFSYLDGAKRVMMDCVPDFSVEDWNAFLSSYLENGICAVHHSEKYRECEKPSYRIIRTDKIKEEWI